MVLKTLKIPSGSHIVGQLYGVPHGIFQESLTLFFTKLSFKILFDARIGFSTKEIRDVIFFLDFLEFFRIFFGFFGIMSRLSVLLKPILIHPASEFAGGHTLPFKKGHGVPILKWYGMSSCDL
jgi:hypothetical protein